MTSIIEHLKGKLDSLEKAVLIDPERAYQNYLIEDLMNSEETDFVITDFDEYLFWRDNFLDLKYVTDSLRKILEESNSETTTKVVWKMLDKCISIKLVIDKKLQENQHFSGEDKFLEEEEESVNLFIELNGDKMQEKAKLIFDFLTEKLFIKSDFKSFYQLFTGHHENRKIQWLQNEKYIVLFFTELITANQIAPRLANKKGALISELFINKSGKHFKKHQLSTFSEKLKNLPDSENPFLKLINDLKELDK